MRRRKQTLYDLEGKKAVAMYTKARMALQALVMLESKLRGNPYRLRASKALVELIKG